MLEMVFGGKKQVVIGAPILGYNWDQGRSISSPPTTTSGGTVTTFGSGGQLSGYSKGIRALSQIVQLSKPSPLNTLGLQDFTCEGWFWCSTIPNSYQTIFQIKWPNVGDVFVQFGDGGFGNRLQTGLRAVFATNENFCAPFNNSNFLNKWHHIALVRKDQVMRLYIDGNLQTMAVGTSTSYTTTTMTGNVDLQGTPSICQISGTYATPSDIYCPEFLLTIGAKYLSNFTPPVGPIYKG